VPMSQKFYAVLERTIAAARQDPAQLRALVYQLARLELKRAVYKNDNSDTLTDAKYQITALETAIEQIESNFDADGLFAPSSACNEQAADILNENALVAQGGSTQLPARQVYTPDVLPPLGYAPPFQAGDRWLRAQTLDGVEPVQPASGRGFRSTSWAILQLVLAAILAVAIYSGLQGSHLVNFFTRQGRSAVADRHSVDSREKVSTAPQSGKNAGTVPASAARTQLAALPIPSVFGVYAVSDGKLRDLGTLPFKVPDPRIAVSAMISHPSAATLPDGRLEFIAFQRDLTDNAPDRASVRVVARVMHALTFDAAGHAKTTDVAGPWAVRDKTYEMRVGPVSGHPDMIVIRPADAHFTFPAGRYAMVLGDTGYDFSVAGPITDPIQCLERTDAVNQPIYNECASP